LKSCYQLILDVRTSAHRPFRLGRDSLCLLCFGFHQKPKAVQTVKLTLYHRTEALRARYTEDDPSNGPNRPHISSETSNFKERETKINRLRSSY
jgi:hypothetical protein